MIQRRSDQNKKVQFRSPHRQIHPHVFTSLRTTALWIHEYPNMNRQNKRRQHRRSRKSEPQKTFEIIRFLKWLRHN